MECASRSRHPEAYPIIQEIDFNPESPHEGNLILKVRMKAFYFLKVRMKAIFIIGAYAHSFAQRCFQDMLKAEELMMNTKLWVQACRSSISQSSVQKGLRQIK